MIFTMSTPCDECPLLKKYSHAFTMRRLRAFASGAFACHKACDVDEESGDFAARDSATPHCAGALIFNEKRECPHQLMRIAERLGLYDRRKLNMKAPVR